MTAGRLRPTEVEWDLVNEGVFTPAVVALLIKAVGRGRVEEEHHQTLADFLNEAVRSYFEQRRLEEQPSGRQRAAAARRLALACDAVLVASGVRHAGDVTDLYPSLGPGGLFAEAALLSKGDGREAILRSLEGVRLLKSCADRMGQRPRLDDATWDDNSVTESDLQVAKPVRNKGSKAYSRLLQDLNEAYLHWWTDIPARANGGDDGPFIRFLSNVSNHLSESFCSFHKRRPSALAQAWRRTDAASDMHELQNIKEQFVHATTS